MNSTRQKYLLPVLLILGSINSLAHQLNSTDLFRLFLGDVPFGGIYNDFSEILVARKVHDFIQEVEDPFGIHSFPFGTKYTIKATVLDVALLKKGLRKKHALNGKKMNLNPVLSKVFKKRNYMLIKHLSNAGCKQTLSDSTLALLAEAKIEREPSLLCQLEAMGVIYKN